MAVRRWFLSELTGQLHGKAPVAWVDSRFHAELQADVRPLSGAGQRYLAVAFFNTLP